MAAKKTAQKPSPETATKKPAKKAASASKTAAPKADAKKAAAALKAEPKKAEPKKAEPKKAEPKKAELKKAEPKKAEPKKAEPKKAEPKKAEPKKAEPKKAEPKSESVAKPSLTETVKRAAAKVAQVAASAALKVLDSDARRKAPSFELSDESGKLVSSTSLAGKPYLIYFYPKDDTPGCTKEACDIRDSFARFGKQGLRVVGVSPDSSQSHTKFIKKYGLPFTLLSDPDKTLATAYGVWGEKSNYGKKYMGIIRSSFLVGADGTIKKAYRGVKVDGHVSAVLDDAKAVL